MLASRRIAATRRGLLLTSALIGVGALPQVALAQGLPVPANAGGSTITTSGGSVLPPAPPTDMQVDLNGTNRIITWSSFNVAGGNTVSYLSNGGTPADRLTVINRVERALLSPAVPSTINGSITANNINFWLINPDGVTFGNGGSFSGGGLVVSTLPLVLSDADRDAFLAPGGALPATLRFAETGTGATASIAPVRFLAAGSSGGITASGAIVAIAQRVENQKSLTATDGAVALIAASDVTFSRGVDNPLFVTLNAGTTLGTVGEGGGVAAGGIISGGSVLVAGGAESAITGALLGVTAQSLTATAANGSVVLATTSTGSGPGTNPGDFSVRISNAVDAGIEARGALVTGAGGQDVVVAAAGAVDLSAETFLARAGRDVLLSAGADLIVGGVATTTGPGAVRAISAGRDYGASGVSVRLGRDGATTTQSAAGAVTVTASGDIAGEGAVTLQSNTDGTGPGALTLDADGAIAFDNQASALRGGQAGALSDVLIGAGGEISLGAVTGQSLRTLGNAENVLDAGANAMSTGSIDVIDALGLYSNANVDVAGTITVRGAGNGVDLRGNNITVDGATAANGGDILAAAGGDIAFTGIATTLNTAANATTGSIALLADRGILRTGTINAGEDVAIRAVENTIVGALTAGDDARIAVDGDLTLTSISTRNAGSGVDARSVVFDDPADPARRITFGAENATRSNIALRADTVRSASALAGSTDAGLVVESVAAGGTALALSADAGDIRLGALNAGNVAAATSVTATLGSVSGLATDWTVTSGGSTLSTISGDVTLDIAASATIGSINAGGAVSNSAGPTALRIGDITAGSLSLAAGQNLQLGDLSIAGDVSLRTTVGAASTDFALSGRTDLIQTHHRAGTGADGLGVTGLTGGRSLNVTANEGVAWLGTASSGSVAVQAAALDVTRALSTIDTLTLVATDGRLTLGSGEAKTVATVWKRNDDGGATSDDALFVNDTASGLVTGSGMDVRSVTDLTVQRAVAATGDIRVQAAGDAAVNVGRATAGTFALLAGRNAVSSTSLAAGEDVAVRAGVDFSQANPGGGNVTVGTLTAGDDIDLFARGTLTLNGDLATGSVPPGSSYVAADNSSVTFVQPQAGLGDPIAAPASGGIAIGPPEPLSGNRVRLVAGTIAGGGADPVSDTGLIVGMLTAGLTTIAASADGALTSRDIRLGSVNASGDLTVTSDFGSVSGTRPGWTVGAGGARITTSGDVVLETSGDVRLGGIITDGAVGATGTLASVRIGEVRGGSVNFTATGDLQIGSVSVGAGDARLTTLGGTSAGFSLSDTPLVAGRGAASLATGGLLRVGAAEGAAQLGIVAGADIRVIADAADIVSAMASTGDLYVRAERGRLTLGEGEASGAAILWKRSDLPAGAADPANILSVTGTTQGVVASRIDIRSTSDAIVSRATARDGDLLLEAANNATLNNGLAISGTIAILAGTGNVNSTLGLIAGEDVAIRAGGAITLNSGSAAAPHLVIGDDDVDLDAAGQLFISEVVTTGIAARDTRAVAFGTSGIGMGDPEIAGTSHVTFASPDALAGSNIRLRAGSVTGPGAGGTIDDGLVIGRLNSADATIDAVLGDIRIDQAVARTGNLTITAAAGSVTGTLRGWATRSGASVLTTPGQVILRSDGDVAIGLIAAGGAVSGEARVGGGAMSSVRIGTIRGEAPGWGTQSVTLTAVGDLQIGEADVIGTADLSTTGGSADALLPQPLGSALVANYGAANLSAANNAATLAVSARGGAAQLGVISGGTVDVEADAIDIRSATSTFGTLHLLAESGRLKLGTGAAATRALLWKRNDDGAGDPTEDLLSIGTVITATSGIDIRSATDAAVARAVTSDGDLLVQASRDVFMGVGAATAGSLALLAGSGNVVSNGFDADLRGSLIAGEDVRIDAGGDVTLLAAAPGARHLVSAADDVDLSAGGVLKITDVQALATGLDTRAVVTDRTRAGSGDPKTAGSGGIVFAAESTLAGSNIRLRAREIRGPADFAPTDTGLLIGMLSSESATITAGRATPTAGSNDVRIGTVSAGGGDLTVVAATGSVTGLRAALVEPLGGATLLTPGRVTIEAVGPVEIGAIAGLAPGSRAGAVIANSTGSLRYGSIAATSLDLNAGTDLEVVNATIAGTATLATSGDGAIAPTSLFGTVLAAGYGAADLTAAGALAVRAAIDPDDAATGPIGVAQLGRISGSRLAVTADAIDIAEARATGGAMELLAERGRLTLGLGDAVGKASLWKRDKDAAAGVAADVADALFVRDLLATGGIDARSATDATITTATARGGDLLVQAARTVSLATGAAAIGSLAIAAGADAGSLVSLTAREDVAIHAGGNVTLGVPGSAGRHAVRAGDAIDLFAGGTLYFTDLTTSGDGANTRGITFVPAQKGLGDPLVAGTGGILSGAETLPPGTVRLRARDTNGPDVAAPTDVGLVVGTLLSGNAVIDAAAGDIRVGSATTRTGALLIEAVAGSVTGLRPNWVSGAGSSVVTTPGQVIIGNDGTAAIGSIFADGAITGAARDGSGAMGAVRIGTIRGAGAGSPAGQLTLTAVNDLQLGSADVAGAADLSTTGGMAASAISLTGSSLASSHGAADLTAAGALTVRAAVDADDAAVGPIGVAQLGRISGSRLAVTADAIDIAEARATGGAMELLAERGRLTLGLGDAVGKASLWKRDKDAAAGVAADVADALFVRDLIATGGIDARSATDATITTATARGGDLLVQAARTVSLATGAAVTGSLALAAGGDVRSLTALSSGEDVAIDADGSIILGTIGGAASHAVNARDDIDLRAGATIHFTNLTTTGAGRSDRGVTYTALQKGLGDPLQAGTGGIAFGAETLPAGTVRLRARDITGPSLAGSTDAGLVVEQLTSGSASLAASLGDIRIGTAAVTGALDATATAGSISGLRTGWQRIGGGSAIRTPGQVIVDAANAAIGTIGSTDANGRTGAISSTTTGSARYNSITASSLTLAAGPDLQIGTANVTGATSLSTKGGAASGAIALIGTTPAPDYGRADLGAAGVLMVRASADASDTAPGPIGVAQLGTIRGSSLAVTADAIDVSSATTATGAMTLVAERGRLVLGTATSAGALALTKHDRDSNAGVATNNAFPDALVITGAVTARENITLDTRGDFTLTGSVGIAANGSGNTVRLINRSGRPSAIGVGASGSFSLDEGELGRISAPNVIIDSLASNLAIGPLAIANATGSRTLKFLTSGAITLGGAVTGGGDVDSRTLQIGGNEGDPRVTDGSNLSSGISADTAGSNAGAGIAFTGTVDLRARRIVFGTGGEFLAFGSGTTEAAALAVANAGSSLYIGNRSRETFLTVGRLSVSYSDFALFQNTVAGVSGGAVLGAPGNSVERLALQLYSTGDNRDNSFALFGTINGFIGRAAGVLPNSVLNIAEGAPRVLRVTQSNTRVNGCVIGSPDRGCLITDVPRAEFRLYDERQTQLITAAEDPSLYANPLIGRGNEGLIVDIADVPVGIDTIECPEDNPNCRSPRNPQ